jgi:hypothetical protein
MLAKLRPHLTYANVMATIAVVSARRGGSSHPVGALSSSPTLLPASAPRNGLAVPPVARIDVAITDSGVR